MRTAGSEWPTCMRVCMCPVRQFNVQLYVEKVFIAQKTSEDRGGKVRKRVKDTELLVELTGKGIGGGRAGWEIGRKGQIRVESTRWRRHIARQGNNRAAGRKTREKWYNLIGGNQRCFPRGHVAWIALLARCSAHERTGRAVPSPAHADFKWY